MLSPRVGEVLVSRGLSPRDARTRAHEGRVWLGDTPIVDLSRETFDFPVRLFPDRPRHEVGREAAVVHRDPHLCVVYKPSGLLSVPAPGRREPSVLRAVEGWFGRALAVHRIDEGTSGLLLVALSAPCQLALKSLFEVHDIERRYLALVRGFPRERQRTIRSNLVRNRGDGKRGSDKESDDGKLAITHFQVLDTFHDVSLVEATLETGRTHQVRIHLAEWGHPILGDELYGGPRFSRLALHATTLGFKHPITAHQMQYVSPLPDELWRRITAQSPTGRKKPFLPVAPRG